MRWKGGRERARERVSGCFGSVRFGSGVSTRRGNSDRGGGVGAAARRDRGARGDGVEGGEDRTTTEGRCDAAWNVAATKSARLDRIPSATAPREASTAAPRAPPRVPDASTPAGRMVAIADSTTSPAVVERHATGSARRPPEGTSICTQPRANPRPKISHPSLLRGGARAPVARRIRRFSQKCDLRWTTPWRERTSDPSLLDRSSRSYVLYTR